MLEQTGAMITRGRSSERDTERSAEQERGKREKATTEIGWDEVSGYARLMRVRVRHIDVVDYISIVP